MSSPQTIPSNEAPPRALPVAECERALAAIRRYRDLTYHKERREPEPEGLQSLGDLFPEESFPGAKNRWASLIDSGLSTNAGIVLRHVKRAGISTTYTKGEKSACVLTHYDYWPDSSFQWEFKRIEALMRVLNGAIGIYEERLAAAKRERWNPLIWIAWMAQWPKFVLERSGLAHGKDAGEKALTFWKWVIPYGLGVLTSSLWIKLCGLVKSLRAQ